MTTRSAKSTRLLLGLSPSILGFSILAISYLFVRNNLSDRVAAPIGSVGSPDGLLSVEDSLLAGGLLVAFGSIACTILALWRRPLREGVASAEAFFGGGFTGLGAGIAVVTVLSQRSLQGLEQVSTSWWGLIGVILLGLSFGILTARIAALLPSTSENNSVSELPILPLEGDEQAVWSSSLHSSVLSSVGAGIILLGFIIASGTGWVAAIWSTIIGLVILSLSTVRVRGDREGLHVRYGLLPWPQTNIALDQIDRATAVDVRPREWGGWGYRGSLRLLKRAAVVHRAGPGLRLDLSRGRVFVITVDDPETGAAVLNGQLHRQPAAAGS